MKPDLTIHEETGEFRRPLVDELFVADSHRLTDTFASILTKKTHDCVYGERYIVRIKEVVPPAVTAVFVAPPAPPRPTGVLTLTVSEEYAREFLRGFGSRGASLSSRWYAAGRLPLLNAIREALPA